MVGYPSLSSHVSSFRSSPEAEVPFGDLNTTAIDYRIVENASLTVFDYPTTGSETIPKSELLDRVLGVTGRHDIGE